jgi:hypothetical protein
MRADKLFAERRNGEDVSDASIRLFATTEGRIVPPGG